MDWFCTCLRRDMLAAGGLGVLALSCTAPIHDAAAFGSSSDTGIITDTIAAGELSKLYRPDSSEGIDTVNGRPRPEYSPDGMRLGNFIFYPSISTSVAYDDNIFNTATHKVGDFRYEVAPTLKIVSDMPRHAIQVLTGGRLVSYGSHEDQSFADGFIDVRGALHFDHGHTLSVGVLSQYGHEDRLSPEFPRNAKEPVAQLQNRFSVGLTRDIGRFYGTVSAQYSTHDFHDVRAFDGSTIDQDYRDTSIVSGQLQAGYRFSPGFGLVTKFRVLEQFDDSKEAIDRGSRGYEALAGLSMETSPVMRWSFLAGYGIRDYNDASLGNAGFGLLEGHLQWLPTQTLTIDLAVGRKFSEELTITGGGSIETGASGKVSYEMMRNLIATAGAELRQYEYIGSDRNDLTYGVSVGLEYLHSKNLSFTAGYKHQRNDSNDDSYDMTKNIFTVGAKLRF